MIETLSKGQAKKNIGGKRNSPRKPTPFKLG